MTRLVPRERAEYEPNTEYWDKNRVPKADKVILLPMPEATTRLAALRTGQVDWIEVPPPDAIPLLTPVWVSDCPAQLSPRLAL